MDKPLLAWLWEREELQVQEGVDGFTVTAASAVWLSAKVSAKALGTAEESLAQPGCRR